jgi:hypothetical protein
VQRRLIYRRRTTYTAFNTPPQQNNASFVLRNPTKVAFLHCQPSLKLPRSEAEHLEFIGNTLRKGLGLEKHAKQRQPPASGANNAGMLWQPRKRPWLLTWWRVVPKSLQRSVRRISLSYVAAEVPSQPTGRGAKRTRGGKALSQQGITKFVDSVRGTFHGHPCCPHSGAELYVAPLAGGMWNLLQCHRQLSLHWSFITSLRPQYTPPNTVIHAASQAT